MDINQVAPELRGPVRRIPFLPLGSAWGRGLVRGMSGLIPARKLDGVTIEQRNDVQPRLRLYRPAQQRSAAALYWIHGGGMIIGRPVQDDGLCATTARDLGIVVVSVDYRLAPEHPFPVPLDDCYAGWQWLHKSAAALGVDGNRVAVGGGSAGGGLAASLAQRLHDDGHSQPAAQWLFCPMLDDRTAARRDLDAISHFIWNNRLNAVGWRAFLGVEPGGAAPPYAAAARRQELSGLPPTWIGAGDIELFYAEDRDYAERLAAAGVAVTVDTVPGAPHGFEAWAADTAIAKAYLARARAWLAKTLNGEQAQRP